MDTLDTIIAEMREAGAEWCHRWPQVIDWADRIEALRGAAVAWQVRYLLKDTNYWGGWAQSQSEDEAKEQVARWKQHGFTAEYRALYTAPPAPVVPQEVLEAMKHTVDFIIPARGSRTDAAWQTIRAFLREQGV